MRNVALQPWWTWTPRDFRLFVMEMLADGRELMTREIAQDHSPVTEHIYRAVKALEAHGLISVRRDLGGRLRAQVIYNPELYHLDVLNTVPDDGGDLDAS